MQVEAADIAEAALRQLPATQAMALLMITIWSVNQADAYSATMEAISCFQMMAERFASPAERAAIAKRFHEYSIALAGECVPLTLH